MSDTKSQRELAEYSTDQTGADSPEIGVSLDDRTHYAHVRYAASDEAGVVWYDPRDGREYYTLPDAPADDAMAVGDEAVTSVKIMPFRPAAHGEPAEKYVIKRQRKRKEREGVDREWLDEYVRVNTYGTSEVHESLEAAREWCRENVAGYATAPRRDAVSARCGGD